MGPKKKSSNKQNRYGQIIERVFLDNYDQCTDSARFTREEFVSAARDLGIALPKNLGDVLYNFRYRNELPPKVLEKQPADKQWVIFPAKARPAEYRFAAVPLATIKPTPGIAITKIPDATPGLIDMYAMGDEQALLAKLRYNRLLDIYSGVTTYSLQAHLRTTIRESQVETDEVYVGVDKHGAHHVFPVQAKGGKDYLSIIQIWQDFKMCKVKFYGLVARPIAAQFMSENIIAMFSFDWDGADGITISPGSERHYKLVPPTEVSPSELDAYTELAR